MKRWTTDKLQCREATISQGGQGRPKEERFTLRRDLNEKDLDTWYQNEEWPSNHISDNDQLSRIYKELLQLNNNKTIHTIKKNGQRI